LTKVTSVRKDYEVNDSSIFSWAGSIIDDDPTQQKVSILVCLRE